MRARPDIRPAPAARATAGFTVVELIVVLLILGMVAAVAVPLAVPRPPTGAEATLQDLARLLAVARQEAVTRATKTSLHIELASGAYALLAERKGAGPDTLEAASVRLPHGVALAGGRGGWTSAAFDPLGRARAERLLIISEGEHRELVLDPWTGALTARPLRAGLHAD